MREAAEAELRRWRLPEPKPGKRLGIGVAAGMKNVGLGIGNDDSVHVSLELQDDGSLMLRHGAIDLGQGSNSAMCEIAARVMGIHYDRVNFVTGDTREGRDGGITAASRQTHITGQATFEVSTMFHAHLLQYAARAYNADAARIKLTEDGQLIDLDREERMGDLADLAALARARGEEVQVAHHYVPAPTYRILSLQQRLRQFMPAGRKLILHFSLRGELVNFQVIQLAGQQHGAGDSQPIGVGHHKTSRSLVDR